MSAVRDALLRLLQCRLCNEYYQDAHTLAECLHTFCKECIFDEIYRGRTHCPLCSTYMAPTKILYDRTLQSVVNSLLHKHVEDEEDEDIIEIDDEEEEEVGRNGAKVVAGSVMDDDDDTNPVKRSRTIDSNL